MDPTLKKKLSHKSDFKLIEEKLSVLPVDEQKRWVANPMIEFILQSYMNTT
jgi:hypothetical protein